jgi:hypothetical protein
MPAIFPSYYFRTLFLVVYDGEGGIGFGSIAQIRSQIFVSIFRMLSKFDT